MRIDFSPLKDREAPLPAFAAQFTLTDLRATVDTYIDLLLSMIQDASDAEIAFAPHDPDANDPYAVEGEEHIGWSAGHLIAHVTASTEEGAAFASLLARGVPLDDETLRLRYETPWRAIDTQAKAVQRLEESRRIRRAYFDTWPDAPHLDNYRIRSERFMRRFGEMNAIGAYLFGLWHEEGHLDQLSEALRQAKAALQQGV